jgi:hypothetical protein
VPHLMRVQHASFATLGLALAALLGACTLEGQGAPCSTQGNDCESPLTCLPIPGSTNLGTCCMPNSQCDNAQNGFMLTQDGEVGTPDAAADSPEDAVGADARPAMDASADVDGGG